MPPNTITQDVLLTCLRKTSRFPDIVGALSVLDPDDWDDMRRLARGLGVAPLLYHRLDERGLETHVPTEIWRRLKRSYHSAAAHNMNAYSEMRTLCDGLAARDIPVIALKGAFLTEAVYGNIGLRPMRDIDLLVPRRYLDDAASLLHHNAYRPLSPHDPLDGGEVVEIDQHLPVAFRSNGATAVEIHWSITPPNRSYSIQSDPLWERSLPVRLAGCGCRRLCPEDLLLHVAMHLAYMHDFGFGLRPFCDITETIERYDAVLDWGDVRTRAQEWGWARGVGVALLLAHEWLGAKVPEDVLVELVPGDFDDAMRNAVRESVFGSAAYPRAELPSASFAQMWAGTSLRDRLAILRRSLGLDKSTLARQFGISPSSRWIYLYYPLRLSGLIRRYVPVVGRLARGNRREADLLRSNDAVRRWLSRDANPALK